jgi:hypothetical protein
MVSQQGEQDSVSENFMWQYHLLKCVLSVHMSQTDDEWILYKHVVLQMGLNAILILF